MRFVSVIIQGLQEAGCLFHTGKMPVMEKPFMRHEAALQEVGSGKTSLIYKGLFLFCDAGFFTHLSWLCRASAYFKILPFRYAIPTGISRTGETGKG